MSDDGKITVYYVHVPSPRWSMDMTQSEQPNPEIRSTKARLTKKCVFIDSRYSIRKQRLDRFIPEPEGEVARGYFRTSLQALRYYHNKQDGKVSLAEADLQRQRKLLRWARVEVQKLEDRSDQQDS